MGRGVRRPLLVALAALAVLGAACGGGGDETSSPTEAGEATTSTAAAVPETTEAPDDGGEGTEVTALVATSASTVERCDALFSLAEVADLFQEEAILEEATESEPLGQLLCTWSTIESDDLDDVTSQLLVLQLYTGDPIPGESFYDPSLYEDARDVDGIGDRAFIAHTIGADSGFVDGSVAGFLGYAAIDFADTGVGDDVTDDVVIELLRTFHDRAT